MLLGEVVRKLQQGVLIVGEPKAGHGTAFVISRKHRLLATNAHVADIMAESGTMTAVVSGNPVAYKVKRAWYHPGTVRRLGGAQSLLAQSQDPSQGSVFPFGPDLAVLQLSSDGPDLPVDFPLATPAELETLFAQPIGMLGFPGHDSHFPAAGEVPQPTYHPGVVSRLTDFHGKSVATERMQFVQHTAAGWGGFSGSPIFLTNGHVVALHNMRRTAEDRSAIAHISHGVRIDCLWELLVYHKLDNLLPLQVDKTKLDVARFSKPDPELEKFQRVVILVQEADDLNTEGKYAEAAEKCTAAMNLSPDYPLIYAVRMESHTNYVFKYQSRLSERVIHEQLTLAFENAKKYAQMVPGSPQATIRYAVGLNNLAGAEYRMGLADPARAKRQQVIETLNQSLTIKNLDTKARAEALATRGAARAALNDFKGAEADYGEAIQLLPNAVYFENRAQFYELTGRPQLARADRKEAERLRGTDVRFGLATYVWKEFHSDDGGFRIDFPGVPKLNTYESTDFHYHLVSLVDTQNGTTFLVAFGDWPDAVMKSLTGPEQMLDKLSEPFLGMGKVMQQKKVQLNGHPGRELEVQDRNNKVTLIREFAVGSRFFLIGVEGDAGRIQAPSEPVTKFMDSFALLAKEKEPTKPQSNLDWQTFHSSEGRFQARFPVLPKPSTKQGADYLHHLFTAVMQDQAVTFVVDYFDLSPEQTKQHATPDERLKWVQDKLVSDTEEFSAKKIQQAGFPGRELQFTGTEGALMIARLLVVENRMYQYAVTGPASRVSAVSEDVRRFLDSFSLVAPTTNGKED